MKTPEPKAASQHTPGPWKYDSEYDFIEGPHGEWITDCNQQLDKGEYDMVTAEANAYLIASAPTLLDALEAFVNTCDTAAPMDLMGEIVKRCEDARAAIKLAKHAPILNALLNSHAALLSALEEFVAWSEKNGMWDKTERCYYLAKSAIKLAKGET